jgi:mRNA interferase MazF
MNPQPGEIWLADLGLAAKTQPVVIVSRADNDPPRALVLYEFASNAGSATSRKM